MKEYIITWIIENYSNCWHESYEPLASPAFVTAKLGDTKWSIRLYPRGYEDGEQDCVSLYLFKEACHNNRIWLKYEFSFLGVDGSALKSEKDEKEFYKLQLSGFSQFLQLDELLLRHRDDYLPRDTLTVRCKMWYGEGDIENVGQVTARTRIGIKELSFLHVVENFSTLGPFIERTFRIPNCTKEEHFTTSIQCVTDSMTSDERIMVQIAASNSKKILSKCKVFLLGTSGDAVLCGEEDNRSDGARRDISKFLLSLRKKAILSRKEEFLPNDKLSLLWECTFSTGEKYENIEKYVHKLPSGILNKRYSYDENNGKDSMARKISACPSVVDDLKTFYLEKVLTDVELKTGTKSFPAHKSLLCARSPVFKAMFTNDMKEKNTNCIHVDGLENETVEQLLLFLYTDNLENLQTDSALKLYYAADKYAIEKLKLMCHSVFVDKLDPSTAVEFLVLADSHNDSDLKKTITDFILEHENQIFGSDEWISLIKTHPALVSTTMCLKYTRNM